MYARATAVSHVQSGEEWFQAWRDHTYRYRKKTLGAWGEPGHTRDERDTRAHTGTRTGTVPPPVFLIHEFARVVPQGGPPRLPQRDAGLLSSSCSSFVQFSDTFSLNSFVALLRPSISGRLSVSRLSPAYSRTRHIACPWCPVGDEGARTWTVARPRGARTHTHTQRSTGHASSLTSSSHHACVRETHSSNCNPIASPLVEKRPRSRGEPSPARPRAHHGALLTPRWHAKKATAIAT